MRAFNAGNNNSSEAGTYSAATATLIEDSAQVICAGAVNSLGSSLVIFGVANFDPAVSTTTPLITNQCTIDNSYLAGTDNLVVTGTLTLVGGILQTTGTIDAEGGVTIEAFQPSSTGAVLEYGTLNNYGTATWTGGAIIANNGVVFNNEPGATFNALSDDSFIWTGNNSTSAGAVPIFNNLAGAPSQSPARTGSAGTQVGVVFNNAGAVDVSSGTLALGAADVTLPATSSGSFQGALGPRWTSLQPRISRPHRASTPTRWSLIPETTTPAKLVHTARCDRDSHRRLCPGDLHRGGEQPRELTGHLRCGQLQPGCLNHHALDH